MTAAYMQVNASVKSDTFFVKINTQVIIIKIGGMNMSRQLAEILGLLPQMFIQYKYFTACLDIRRRKPFFILSTGAIILIRLIIHSPEMFYIRTSIIVFTYVTIILIFSSKKWYVSLFSYLLFTLSTTAIEIFFVSVLNQYAIEMLYGENLILWLIVQIIFFIPFVVTVFLCYKLFNQLITASQTPGFTLFIWFLISQTAIILIFAVTLHSIDDNELFASVVSIAIILLSILSDIPLFRAIKRLSEQYLLKEKQIQAEHQLKIQLDYYKQLQSQISQTAKMRHDFRNQLQTLRILIENMQYDVAESQLEDISHKLSGISPAYTKNAIVEAVLRDKMQQCIDNQITLNAQINLPEVLSVDGTDLCSIFSNTLDNAIRANTNVEIHKRYINLSAFIQGEAMVLTASNPVSAEQSQVKSTNPETIHGRGLGLVILSDIAEQYGGWVKTERSDSIFEITVYINVPEIKLAMANIIQIGGMNNVS